MSGDVKAAADRLRGIEGPTFHGVGGKRHIVESEYAAAVTLAMEWLREHPADTDEPATEEWLRGIGYEDDPEDVAFLRLKVADEPYVAYHSTEAGDRAHPTCGREVMFDMYDDGSPETIIVSRRGMLRTRGDFRRLLTALGLTLPWG